MKGKNYPEKNMYVQFTFATTNFKKVNNKNALLYKKRKREIDGRNTLFIHHIFYTKYLLMYL
jgi:hypothetical protein